MKKSIRKIGALVLALALIFGMSATVFAAKTLDDNGEQGAFASKDTPVSQSKTLVLEKEIKVYNKDEATIKAPTISYTYSISPATFPAGATVTDAASKHASNSSVTVPVKAGVGTPAVANSGVVAWTSSDDVTAADDGAKNVKDISIDFSSVVFPGPGVYRYEISEGLTSGYAYASSGVTETDGAHKRYIDVYVKPVATGFTDGSAAADWDIYGYTCFYNNDDAITDANKTTDAVKTTGFVAGTTDGSTAITADSYYTFNVIISKTVTGDAYGAATVAFPFTVLFTNGTVSAGTIVTNGATAPTGNDFTHSASVDLTTGDLKGVATLKSGQQIKYVGIPNGTGVEVYETNVASGITYEVSTSVDGGAAAKDNAVTWGTAPASAVAQTTKAAYESTKATISTTAGADDNTAHSVAITNNLLVISPTGYALRIAPFALIFAAGAVLLVLSRRRKFLLEEF